MHHKIENTFITRFYGITQDPETKNYIMVLDYADQGSLRNYLDKVYDKLSWDIKFSDLWRIAFGLQDIHMKELIHRDLHIGNILSFPYTCIADMGLCRSADYDKVENTNNNKIYGVLPYILHLKF